MITVRTDHPVAIDSPDHLHPWGTRHDNSRCAAFNAKLIALVPNLSVLDLGCSGGGFVKDITDAGYMAVGIEGSDLSKRQQRAEWATIPERLFTADITKPFLVSEDFSIVTAWEVIEHIAEHDLDAVFANVAEHLMPGGLFIMSVSTGQDWSSGTPLHQTVQSQLWWHYRFLNAGWENRPEIVAYFGDDMVRVEDKSFHVCLTRAGEAPAINRGVLP